MQQVTYFRFCGLRFICHIMEPMGRNQRRRVYMFRRVRQVAQLEAKLLSTIEGSLW